MPIINIVVFGKKAILQNPIKKNGLYVLSVRDLMPTIDIVEASLTSGLTVEKQSEIIDTPHGHNITDKKARRAHVRNIKLEYKK